MKPIPESTGVKWAVHPVDTGRIEYIEGLWDKHTLPHENEVITRPFLVDPVSKQPIPVRVVQIVEYLQERPPFLAVVVTLDH